MNADVWYTSLTSRVVVTWQNSPPNMMQFQALANIVILVTKNDNFINTLLMDNNALFNIREHCSYIVPL